MKLCHENHQMFFFTKNDDITLSPPVIAKLLDKLSRFGLIPTFAQELNAVTAEKKQFMVMTSQDEKKRIEFPFNSISVQASDISQEEFFKFAIDALSSIDSLFPSKTSNRIAIVKTSFFHGTEVEYDVLYKKLFTYHAISPIEWDNRIVSRENCETLSGQINIITSIKRCDIKAPFMNGGALTPAVIFETDINTIPQDVKMRFSLADSEKIFKPLLDKNAEASAGLNRYTK